MSSTIVENLKKSGLTQLESEIYVFLNENPQKGEAELCSALRASLSDVRQALASLITKGLVKQLNHDRYDVIPPSKTVEILLGIKTRYLESELAELRESLHVVREALEGKYWEKRYGIRDELLIEPLDDLRSMEIKTAEIISQAQRNISIFTASFEWYRKVRELLLSAIQRGVRIRVLMKAGSNQSVETAKDLVENGAEVRYAVEEWYPVRGTLVDESKLVFLIWVTEKKTSYYRPHYTENLGLIKVFIDAFNRRWERARALSHNDGLIKS
ncbi:MAG: helix-turn-helix domain-containing protein [Candidatus Nezhaarchaeales archaeon]